jgi:hypothetical protein
MMKTVPTKNPLLKIFSFVFLVLLLCQGPDCAFASGTAPGSKNESRYAIQVTRVQTGKKHKIHFYCDSRQEHLFFAANGLEGKSCQLYVFDMDGVLVTCSIIRNRETNSVPFISKGNYFFEVFINDEQVETGQLSAK